MSTNYHIALPSSPKQGANAITWETRLSDLDAGITTAVANAAAALAAARANLCANFLFDPFNQFVPPGVEYDGKTRWAIPSNLSWVVDSNNPYGSNTLRMGTSAAYAGKCGYFAEAGLDDGDKVSFAAYGYAASGTFYITLFWWDKDGNYLNLHNEGSVYDFTSTHIQTIKYEDVAIPAAAAGGHVRACVQRVSGSAAFDIYKLWGNPGSYIGTPVMNYDPLANVAIPHGNMMFDPFNADGTNPLNEWNNTWPHFYPATGANVPVLVDPDAANPYGCPTLRMEVGTFTMKGRREYLWETGFKVGDVISGGIYGLGGVGDFTCRIYFWDSASTMIGSFSAGTAVTNDATTPKLHTCNGVTIPANTHSILLLIYRNGTTNQTAFDFYGWALQKGGVCEYISPVAVTPHLSGEIINARLDEPTLQERAYRNWGTDGQGGRYLLRDWRAAIAKLEQGETIQPSICFLGDSWTEREGYVTMLRTWAQGLWGNAGLGYVSFVQTPSAGATVVRTGTWTTNENNESGIWSRGVDLGHIYSTDIATPAKVTLTATAQTFVIHYYAQAGGGKFRWRVDAGSWTIVDTDAAEDYKTTTVSGLSNASHALDVEIYEAGSQGVFLMGAECKLTANGVLFHKLGSSSAKNIDFVTPTAAVWQAGLAKFAPNLVSYLIGTNDMSGATISAMTTQQTTLVSRIRAAMPLADILFICPSDTFTGPTYSLPYMRMMQKNAYDLGCAFLNLYDRLGSYADGNARGLYIDDRHFNNIGYQFLTDWEKEYLKTS